MFKRKPKQNPLESAARYFAEQQAEMAAVPDPVARYLAARDLKIDTARFLQAHQRAFDSLEDQRMAKTIGGIALGIPAIAGAAVLLGNPLGVLLIAPVIGCMAIHSSRGHRQAKAKHDADMQTLGRTIIGAHKAAAEEMQHILEHHADRFTEAPGGIRLLQDAGSRQKFNAQAAPPSLSNSPKNATFNNNRKGPAQ